MAHHANDHALVGAAVAISGSDLAGLRELITPIAEASRAALEDRSSREVPKTVVFSDAQFAELKELLRPGYELSAMLLEQYRAVPNDPPLPVAPIEQAVD